ncbi:epoxide hydrolase family protein [Paenibacillus glucanolyticus]|uniref:epoxide hydrolase family protein n=1 Tax=Paenibacillus glucanolyticus TaxID=59843 RepID=UPI00096D808B|nr:epoxide hydrolase family protein [Paenibacillus glucanolyticus]OMF81632.1 epoxide hydrolase [Paenibacillus glucanolyticus]
MKIRPFSYPIEPAAIDDLYQRLDMTRWPDEIPGGRWNYGIPLDFMKNIIAYWRHEFDWEAFRRSIHAYPSYVAEIDGVDIHYIHIKGSGDNRVPLLIAHGWPSSFYEMLELIPCLTNRGPIGGRADISFDLIIPSLPGHGFSGIPLRPGFEDRQAGELLMKLMTGLGYERFGAHGYDIGASILGLMCLDHPDRFIGYHTTSPGNPSPCVDSTSTLSDEERAFLQYQQQWYREEGGYAHILGTKPQTAAYGLHDSPVALAAFILEKWHYWTSPEDNNVLQHFSKELLIANVSIYWLAETINASNRYYYEGTHTRWPGPGETSPVPHAVTLNAQRNERPPREYVERIFPNVIRWKDLNSGGHFIAAEQPASVAQQIVAFFDALGNSHEVR